MKLIHLGDLHFGKSVNEFSMIEDQRFILQEILKIIEEKEVDTVLIAGDVFDRSVPSEEAVRLFDEFLTDLVARKKQVFVISGNHDSDERLNFGSRLFRNEKVYISGKYTGKVDVERVEDEYGPINVYLMPYVKASMVAHYFPEEKITNYDSAFKIAIDKCNVNTDERNIILTHQFVTGKSLDTELSGSESSILNVGNVDKIYSDCFAPFDYVAMGHIHSAQAVGRETIRYAGSPLKYSLSEREIRKDKTVPVVTLKEKGNVEVEIVPLKPLREVRHIRGKLEELLENATDCDDYIYVTLTDEESQYDAMSRMQEVYPHTMKLDYDNRQTRALQEEEGEAANEDRSFHELMSDFYKLIKGGEPTEEEWKLLEEVAKEAGVME